jgi:hypothetical protein
MGGRGGGGVGRGAAGAGIGRGGIGAAAGRAGAAGVAGEGFLGATLRAAAFTRRTTFLPAFLAFFAAAFTLRLTLAFARFAPAFRRALVFIAFRAPFLADFRAGFFFFFAAFLAMKIPSVK